MDDFEDSSSLSSGISENFDDISTDDLTASSLSDHPMTAAAAAYGKLDEYQQQHCLTRQLPPKRSASANQSDSALRLHQRRLHEQENIDQLLQKCRTSQRGIACNLQLFNSLRNGQ
uniref:Schwannomin interacting protein 1 C-terminal domain-containing protein n=1 Tax=Syphacia muris TaxID=451379 RepID=A0A0N5A9W1_9BILA